MTTTGQRTQRPRDRVFLEGQARFLDDIHLPEMAHVAFVRSSHAHALIRGIDGGPARRVPGVLAVLTLDDIAPKLGKGASTTRRMPLIASATASKAPTTPFILADTEVAYVGELIALVVADSRYAAEDGAD